MKKQTKALIAIFTMCLSTLSYSQDEITGFLDLGHENASLLISSYLEPLGHSVGSNMNSGWYNTGQAHSLGRFDVRFGVPVTFVGQEQRYFVFYEDDYTGIKLVDPADTRAPTLFGSDKDGPEIYFEGTEDHPEGSFNLPPGTGIDYFPLIPPVLQVNVGLIRDTEVMFRYVPTIGYEGFSIGLYGFGIKHGVDQYIPVVEKLPFDISLIGSYANMSTIFEIDYNSSANSDNDQKLDISSTAYSASLVASKRLPFISVYGGVRYMYSNTRFLMLGDYDVNGMILTDPADGDILGSQFGLNAGTRLKLGFLSFFVDATWAKYSSVTGGISLGFHN